MLLGSKGFLLWFFCCVISTVSPCVIGVVFDLFLVSLYCLFFFLACSVLSTRSWCCVDGAPVWTVGIRVLIFLPMRPCAGGMWVVVCAVELCIMTILKTSRLGSFPSRVAVCATFTIFFMKFSAKPLPSGC